eukprot:m.16504 g.16504  ORF g.16504 m.16504 type:complete len:332 (+) comp5265_c0_seq2:185-1180(+)
MQSFNRLALAAVVLMLAASHCQAANKCIAELWDDTPEFDVGGVKYTSGAFNVLSCGSVVAVSGDIQGRLAALGAIILGAFSVGDQINTQSKPPTDHVLPYALVGASNVTFTGALYPRGDGHPYPGPEENMFVSGSFNGPKYLAQRVTGGPCDDCLTKSFTNSFNDYYKPLVKNFASETPNARIYRNKDNALVLEGDSTSVGRYYVHCSAAVWNAPNKYFLLKNINKDAEVILTIDGSTEDIYFTGGNLPLPAEHIVYNSPTTGKIFVTTARVPGSILAPWASLHQTGGVIEGFVVANDVPALLQVNKPQCISGPAPPPPPACDCCSKCDQP